MNIKDAYIHGSDAVVKSINVNADKLIYKLADKEETLKTITLPTATTSANGLMSADLVKKINNIQLSTDKKVPIIQMLQEAYDHQVLIPYMQNDIAYPIKRGGYIKVFVDGVEKTGIDDTMCNGMPDFEAGKFTGVTKTSVVTIEIDGAKTIDAASSAFITFPAFWLIPTSIKLEVKNLETDEWTVVKDVTDNATACFACYTGYYTYRYLKYTISGFPSTQFRVCEIGVAAYNSNGLRNIVLSRGGGEMYGNITPYKNNGASLGSADKAWATMFSTSHYFKRGDGGLAFLGAVGNNVALYTKNGDDSALFVFDDAAKSFRRGGNSKDLTIGQNSNPWKNVFATQLTSTVADGTAPLVVSSKTMVSNLNAEMVGGFKYQYSSSIQDVPYKKLMTIRLKNSHLNSPISFDINQRSAKTRSTVCARFNGTLGSYTIMLFKYMGDSLCANLRIYNAGNSVDENGAVVAQTFEIWTTKKGEHYDSLTISNIHCNHQDVRLRQISIECHSTYADALPTYTTFVDCTLGEFDVIASSSKMLFGSSNSPLNVGNYFTPVYFNGGVPISCRVLNNNKNFGGIPYVSDAGNFPIGKMLQFHMTSDEDTNKNANLRITARDANNANGEGLTIGGNTIASGKFAQYSGFICCDTASLSSYWGKLWELNYKSRQNDLDVTIYIHSSFSNKRGIVHLRVRFEAKKNEDGTYTEGSHYIYFNQIVGNLTLSSFRLYYKCDINASTGGITNGQIELWCNVASQYGVYNAVLLSATTRVSKEDINYYGTFSQTTFTTVQTPTLPNYVEMTNVTISQTSAKALAADKAYNADNATNASYADRIFIRQDNTTNKDLPIPWLSNDDATQKNVQVYKSFGDLSYNPLKKRITTGLFRGCIESVAIPSTDAYSLQYVCAQPTLGDAAGNAKEGSNADPNIWSYPKGGTGVNETKANIQTLRFRWSGTYFHDLFMSPNYPGLWHRWVYAGTAYSWHKILESNDTYIKDGVISIGGVTMTPVTAHQDLSNYVRLDTAQTISGKKTFTGDIQFNATNVGDVTSKIVWKGVNDSAYLYYDYLEDDKGKLKFEISDNTDDSIEFWWKISGSDGSVRRHYIDYNNLVITGTATATTFKGNLDWGYITNKPTSFTPSAHTHASNQITALTGYSKSTAASDLAATDSLNTALGKLEYKSDYAYDWIIGVTATDADEYINKWSEIVGFLDSVKEGTDITDEFVTRKTSLTITGTKSFTSEVRIYGDDYGVRLFGSGEYGYLLLGLLKGDEKVHKGKITGFQSANLTSLDIHSNSSIFSGNVTASKFIKSGGTSTLFLKADGSVDSNTYATTGSLGNYVTLNTSQTITGSKTFTASANIFKGTGATILTVDRNSTNPAWIRFCKDGNLQGYIGVSNDYNPVFFSGESGADIKIILHSGNYTSYTPILNSSSTHATNTSVIYAPTTGGTSGLILKSNGSSAPTWVSGSNVSVGNSDKLDNLHASDFVRTVYGYLTTSGTKYVKLGTLPVSSNGTYDSFVIKGSIGGWGSTSKSYINISVSRRDSVGFLGSVQSKNTDIWDIGVNSGGEIFLIFKNQYTAWSLSLHTNLGTIDYVENATPADTTWTLLSESSNILWYSNTGVVNSATIASKVSNALTFSAGKFATKTYDGSSAVTVNIPTKTSHLTNDSGFLTSRGYIGTTAVQASSASLNLTGIGNLTMSGNLTLQTASGDSPAIVFHRGAIGTDTTVDWRIYVTAGHLKIQNALSAFNSGAWTDVLHFEASLTNALLKSTYSILPSANNTRTLGTSSSKWSNVYATTFTGNLIGKLILNGGSHNWYDVQQYDSNNANPSYYVKDCAVINITSYSGWLPWIRAVDSEKGSWTIGLFTTNFHIGYIPKTNTSNNLTYDWTFYKNGSTTFPGNVTAPTFTGDRVLINKSLLPDTNNPNGYAKGLMCNPEDLWSYKITDVVDKSVKEIHIPHYGYACNYGNYHHTDDKTITQIGSFISDYFGLNFHVGTTNSRIKFGYGGGDSLVWGTVLTGGGALTLAGSATASGFKKANSSDSYVLLGGGGHKALSTITASTANSLSPTIIRSSQTYSLLNTTWLDTGYTFAISDTGTYAIQITSTNLVASGIMSVYKNLSDSMGDEIPLHVYGTAGWRPYLRTSSNKLLISSDDAPKKNADGTISGTSRTVTIKIARIL